jgi:hypothetical protein
METERIRTLLFIGSDLDTEKQIRHRKNARKGETMPDDI